MKTVIEGLCISEWNSNLLFVCQWLCTKSAIICDMDVLSLVLDWVGYVGCHLLCL